MGATTTTWRHGTPGGADRHRKEGIPLCPPCQRASNFVKRKSKLRRAENGDKPLLIDATGTRRRLQALACLGWSSRDIARELDYKSAAVSNTGVSAVTVYTTPRQKWITVWKAEKVKEVYERLSMTQPEDSPGHRRVRSVSQDKKWAPPLAWDDETIEDPDAVPVGMSQQRTWDWVLRYATPEAKERWTQETGWYDRKRRHREKQAA